MIIDGVIILLFLIALFIGYKVGFLRSIIKVASALCGLLFALIFFGRLADKLIDFGWESHISNQVYENIIDSDVWLNLDLNAENSLELLIKDLGIPNFLSEILANSIANSIDATDLAITISNILANIAVNVLAFLMLLFGTSLVFLIFKLIVSILRTSSFVRVLDGVLGVVWASLIYFVSIYIVFFILYLVIDIKSVNEAIGPFITEQMRLDQENSFTLGKYFYQNNVLTNIFKLFF